jgi:hypothetical protein
MSPVVVVSNAAAIARERQREEEDMTPYSAQDLDGWEFKIVRSATGKFRNPEFLRQVCTDEARAGWEMLEKFDNYRVRFKRRTDKRYGDASTGSDPYRTTVGASDARVAVFVIAALAIAAALIAAIALTVQPH